MTTSKPPKNVRNFWLSGSADGGPTIGTGPRAADGGFDLTIRQRDAGEVREVLEIRGRWRDGRLTLVVAEPRTGEEYHRVETYR